MDAPPRKLNVVRLAFTGGGFSLIAAGLAGYDWRIAAIVCGALLLLAAVHDARARGRNP